MGILDAPLSPRAVGRLLPQVRSEMSRRIALLGDSRQGMGNKTFLAAVTSASISGATLTVTCPGLSAYAPGREFYLARCAEADYLRARILSGPDGNGAMTAEILWPPIVPQGAIASAAGKTVLLCGPPTVLASPAAWLIAMLGQPADMVRNYAYHGCRTVSLLTHQIPAAKAEGLDEAWLHIGANDYVVDGKPASYILDKIFACWDSLSGYRARHFLECPLNDAWATAQNMQTVLDVNAGLIAAAPSYGVEIEDIYTPILDTATGKSLPGMQLDGLHWAMKGARTAALARLPSIERSFSRKYRATAFQKNTVLQPNPNPTLDGVLGVGNAPSDYNVNGATGAVTIVSTELLAGPHESNIYRVGITSSGAGSHFIQTPYFTVVPGTTYRIYARIKIKNGVRVNYPIVGLHKSSDLSLIAAPMEATNYTATGGDVDGDTEVVCNGLVTIPAGVTSVFIRPRVYMGSLPGGSATIEYSDIEARPVLT